MADLKRALHAGNWPAVATAVRSLDQAIEHWHHDCCVHENWAYMRRCATWNGEGEPP
jgi:hypothetical protein